MTLVVSPCVFSAFPASIQRMYYFRRTEQCKSSLAEEVFFNKQKVLTLLSLLSAITFYFLLTSAMAAASWQPTATSSLLFQLKYNTAEAERQVADSLESELKKASTVIRGRVVEADIENEDTQPKHISQHDPLLRKAVVETIETVKGSVRKKKWTVYYAASNDVLWYNSPKLKKGQVAIFLLQSNQLPPSDFSGYTVLRAVDVQPLTAASQIKALLTKGNQRKTLRSPLFRG